MRRSGICGMILLGVFSLFSLTFLLVLIGTLSYICGVCHIQSRLTFSLSSTCLHLLHVFYLLTYIPTYPFVLYIYILFWFFFILFSWFIQKFASGDIGLVSLQVPLLGLVLRWVLRWMDGRVSAGFLFFSFSL